MLYLDQPNKLYLGSVANAQTHAPLDDAYQLTLRDLCTHAICLGMTGTGKSGLGITVIEEALLQGVPAIVIDPKGDLTNLLLTFPHLSADEFRPWVEPSAHGDAAENAAKQWRDGLAASGQSAERVARLADRADVRIYTPGSDAGIPVNVLQSFAPPREGASWATQTDVLRERISQTVTALLQLIGFDGEKSDPLKSRDHILLSTIFESAWRAQQPLDVPLLIRMIQDPPVARVGVFDMEAFYPKTERFELAMQLNNLAASPRFQSWRAGEPIDMRALTKPIAGVGGSNPIGKTRCSVFYVAHLDDAERQFFITLLLTHVLTWMRAQGGTSVLRCLVYFDEVYGYCPPFPRNPSTKPPLMALLKQGRAAGLGMFLATQNPADLDYKGLSNIGTWFVGRLRTERDRERALEGLEGAGIGFNRREMEQPLATLPPRVFLAQSARGDTCFVKTRWTLNYLCGPLTREQLQRVRAERNWGLGAGDLGPLKDDRRPKTEGDSVQPSSPSPQPLNPDPQTSTNGERPQFPPDVREVFLQLHPNSVGTRYVPHLLASAIARINDRANGVMHDQRFTYLITLDRYLRAPDFTSAQILREFDPAQLTQEPQAEVQFTTPPPGITAKWMRTCEKQLLEHVYRNAVSTVWVHRTLKLFGKPEEEKSEFRARVEESIRPRREVEADRLRTQFERRIQALQDRLAREERELTADRKELNARKREETLTNMESAFNWLMGRGRNTGRGISRGAQKRRETQQSELDMRDGEATLEHLRQQLADAYADYQRELNAINDKWIGALDDIDSASLVPRKTDIFVDVVALTWVL